MSDISLAVGDGARRMTYAELATVRGISALSAERLVRRRHWPRQVGNDGVVCILVPLTEVCKTAHLAPLKRKNWFVYTKARSQPHQFAVTIAVRVGDWPTAQESEPIG